MNIIPAPFDIYTHACAFTANVVLALALAPNVYAANSPVRFTVAASQLQVLGIETLPLKAQGEPVRVSYPAQTVLPPSAEQVISSPVAGLIMQLLVQPNQDRKSVV